MSDSTAELKKRTRTDYPYFLEYRTRWSDNDQYSHMNNSIYYHLFDSVVNTYLIEHCGLDPTHSPQIGLVVSSFCQARIQPIIIALHGFWLMVDLQRQYFAPAAFPEVLDLGLRVSKLGERSVTYEIGVFKQGAESPGAVGGYTHVFVDSKTRKSVQMDGRKKEGLEKLVSRSKGKL